MLISQGARSSRRKPATAGGLGSREVLLETVSQLLKSRDTLDVSLSEIAQRSGVSSALVKYYFGSKNGLLLALVERDSGAALGSFLDLLQLPLSPRQKLRYHIEGIIRTHSRFPYLPALVNFVISQSDPEEAAHITDRFIRPIADAHSQLIGQGVEAGEFNEIDPKAFYFLVIGVSQELFTSSGVAKHCFGIDEISPELVTDYTNQIWKILWGGIGRDKPSV